MVIMSRTTAKEQANNRRVAKPFIRPSQFWFIALGPDGEEVLSNNQMAHAKRYGLSYGNISECLAGRRKQTKGWRFIKHVKLS